MKKKIIKKEAELVPVEIIQNKIYLIRGQKVMLDKDLAELYGVMTKNLNKAVRRNLGRFPGDFAFMLTEKEYQALRFQIGTLKRGQHSKFLPLVFTEQGVAMLSSVLNSSRAIQVNIQIMRVFTQLREMLATNKELSLKLDQLEKRIEKHDGEIGAIFEAIRRLMTVPASDYYKRTRVGFIVDDQKKVKK